MVVLLFHFLLLLHDSCRLVELGPRLSLTLIKIEEGLMDGAVLYHSIVKKSKEEIEELTSKVAKSRRLKEARKKEQAKNVEKKQSEKKSNRKTRKLEQLKEERLSKATESKKEGGGGERKGRKRIRLNNPVKRIPGQALKGILKMGRSVRPPTLKRRRKEYGDDDH